MARVDLQAYREIQDEEKKLSAKERILANEKAYPAYKDEIDKTQKIDIYQKTVEETRTDSKAAHQKPPIAPDQEHRQEQQAVITAVAQAVIDEKIKNPKQAQAIKTEIEKVLHTRERLPDVHMFDKNAPSQDKTYQPQRSEEKERIR